MVQTYQRCLICNCYLDWEDLFCSNCGTENPNIEADVREDLAVQSTPSQITFDCDSCGASMAYDADVQALACPYCGTLAQAREERKRSLSAKCVPFRVSSEDAKRIFHQWLGRGFWRPNNLRIAVRIGKQQGVQVPYWAFSARTETRWTADISPAPPGSRGDWQPVFGLRSGQYSGVLVGGSNVLSEAETNSICPFDLEHARPSDALTSSAESYVREQFCVARKMARPKANAYFRARELAACKAEAGGRSRNVRINMEIGSMHGEPYLLPVWIVAYRYRSEVHRVLINGQTGKISGSAPVSILKIVSAVVLLALAATVVLAALIAGQM